jgi:hypothetical protein
MGYSSGPDWPPKIPGVMPPDPFAEFRLPSHEPEKPRKKKRRRNSLMPRPVVSVTRAVIGVVFAALLILLVVTLVRQL